MEHEPPPAAGVAPTVLVRLGELLRAASFDAPTVLERLGTDATLIAPRELTIERRRLGDDRLSALIRLLLLHETVDARAVDLPEAVFLERQGGCVSSSVAVQPWRDLLVAHDWAEGLPADDHVVGASSVTAILADLTVRSPVADVLDLGTGSGAQAMLASRHATRVVGVDLSPRALRLAGWTAALNGIGNVELRLADLRDVPAGERYDLVVANPPFVVSPDRRWLFRDAAGGISQAVVEQAAGLLRNGGRAHVLCQWGLRPGERWDHQPRAWVAAAGCDAWLLRLPSRENVLDYAADWNLVLRADPDEFERAVDRWLEHFGSEGIDRVVFGAVCLQRRDGRNWVRADEAVAWPAGPVGEHVARLFAGQSLVSAFRDDRELFDLRLAPVEGLRLDETLAYGADGFELVAAQLRPEAGLPLRPRLSRAALDVVNRMDGRAPLRDLVPGEEALHVIRELVALGILRVVDA